MQKEINRRRGIRHPNRKQVTKLPIRVDKCLRTLIYDNGKLNLGDLSITIGLALGGEREKSFRSSIKAFALNLSLIDYEFSSEFIFGLLTEISKIVSEEARPADTLKNIFFTAQRISLETHYPQTGKWIRYPLTRKGVFGHAKTQRKFNIPPGPLQYYLLEVARVCNQHAQSLFRPFELIEQELTYSINTICQKSTRDETIIDEIMELAPEIIDEMSSGVDLDLSNKTHVYGSYQKGPNQKPALESHLLDYQALKADEGLFQHLHTLLGILSKETREVLMPSDLSVPEKGDVRHSKIAFISDGKFGKTRMVAICDIISQSAMTGLNEILMNIIRSLFKFDVTYHQSFLPDYMAYHASFSKNTLPFSSDATAFTDRLPRELNHLLMVQLFGKEIGDLWVEIVCKRRFSLSKVAVSKGLPKYIKYSTGTPMGLLTSWSSSALVHHLIVRYCHRKVGAKYNYIILGDDVSIWNPSVFNFYVNTMERLGMQLSKEKSTMSNVYSEFAKRTFVSPLDSNVITEVTGLPGKSSAKIVDGDPSGVVGYVDQLYHRQLSRVCKKTLDLSLDREASCIVSEQVCRVLILLSMRSDLALSRLLNYLSTWIFTDRVNQLNYPIRMTWLDSYGNELLSKIHGIKIEGDTCSIQDFLNLGELSYLPKSDRLSIYQNLTVNDIEETVKRSEGSLQNLEEVKDISSLYKCQLLKALTSRLSKKVLDFLFSDIDMMSDEAIKLLYDYKSTDILNRTEQIFSEQGNMRREISFIRDSKLGRKVRDLYKNSLLDYQNWKYRDYMSDMSNMASSIDSFIRKLDLQTDQETYLTYVGNAFTND